jgi:dihydroxyacid dehydratase/phosphogluconate dehydratase
MILLQIEVLGIKLSSLQSYMNLSDAIGGQLALINTGNSVEIDEQSLKILTRETSIDLVNKFNENQASKANQSKALNSKTNSEKRVSKQ